MKTTVIVSALLALASCATDDGGEDGIDDVAGGKADGFGVSPAEARGILRVANEVSAADLVDKAGVASRAATGIEAHRLGADHAAATADDDKFDTLDELDAVPYVGSRAFEKLLAYAKELGWVTEHQLPGFDETVLVADSGGRLAIVHVGDTFSRVELPAQSREPASLRTHDGAFVAVFDNRVLTIDPRGTVAGTLAVPSGAADVEWAADGSLYVSNGKTGTVAHVAADGSPLATIDLSSARIGTGRIEPRRMLRVRDRLFVQVARKRADGKDDRGALVVIAGNAIERIIELQAQDVGDALNPDFAMAYDAKRDLIIVSAAGVRPSNTGMMLRIEPATLAIHDVEKAASGFQGMSVIGEPYDSLFVIYHTSTPTTSSHLFVDKVAPDGTLTPEGGGTLVDAFDGIDALAINQTGTLVAMANTCVTGFCIGGAGVSFIEAKTRKVLPKLLKDVIGFEPSAVQFLY